MSTATRLPHRWHRHMTAAQFLATFVLVVFTFVCAERLDAASGPVPDVAPGPTGAISTTVTVEPRGRLSLVGQAGGRLTAVAVAPDGRTAVIAEGQRLTTWALERLGAPDADARPPTLVASSPLLGGIVSDIALQPVDGRLYAAVTAGGAGLFVFDLTDPAQPRLLSHLAVAGSARAVAVHRRDGDPGLGWLYISVAASQREENGVWVIDAGDPRAPVDHGIRFKWGYAMVDVAVAGDELVALYSDGYNGALHGYDVSDPLAPQHLGGRDADYNLRYADTLALVGGDDGRVYAYAGGCIVDVTPGRGYAMVYRFPELPGSNARWTVDESGGHARAYALNRGELLAFDVSNPRSPAAVGSYPLNCCEWSGDVAVSNGVAVAVSPEGMVQALDVGGMDTIRLVRAEKSNPYHYTDEIELMGQYALVVHRGLNLRSFLTIFDMTDPSTPKQVSETEVGAERLSVSKTNAFLVNEWTMSLIDVSNPARPRSVFTLWEGPFPGEYYLKPRDATSLGSTMFVASVLGLAVYDIGGSPTALTAVGTADEARAVKARRVALDEGERTILYLAEGPRLHTYDATEPAAPVELGVVTLGGRINDIDVMDGLVYAAVEGSGLQIVDVRQPAQPALIVPANAQTPPFNWDRGWPTRVRVDARLSSDGRRLAYLAGEELIVFDVTDPSAPSLFAGFPPEFHIRDADAAWPWVFFGDEWALRIARMAEPPVPPTSLGIAQALGRVETLAADDTGLVYTDVMGGPLTALDLGNPSAPRVVGRRSTGANTTIDAAYRGHLYLWDQLGNGWWFDATRPEAIKVGGWFAGSAHGLYLMESGGRAWLLAYLGSAWYPPDSQWNGLSLFEVTGGRPVPAGAYASDLVSLPCVTPPAVVHAANGDPILYAALPDGVFAFNLNAPDPLGDPVKVFDGAWWLATDGRYLYRGLADGWEVYDVGAGECASSAEGPQLGSCPSGEPVAPLRLATHRTPYTPSALRFSAGRAWTSDGAALRVLDLSDLAHPVEVASAALPPTGGSRWGEPAVAGTRAYYAGGDNGVWVLEYRPAATWLPIVIGK